MSTPTAFAAALLDPGLPPPEGLITWNGSDPVRRFAVYRNNVIVSLVDALVRYAHGYADQVEADYDAYRQAVQQGRVSIDTGDPLKTGAL